MGSEYQGWVGEGRELFRGEEKSETEEAESRESYNVRNISAGSMMMIIFSTIIVIIISTGGKFPDQSCPTLRSASSSHLCRFPNLLDTRFEFLESLYRFTFTDLIMKEVPHKNGISFAPTLCPAARLRREATKLF